MQKNVMLNTYQPLTEVTRIWSDQLFHRSHESSHAPRYLSYCYHNQKIIDILCICIGILANNLMDSDIRAMSASFSLKIGRQHFTKPKQRGGKWPSCGVTLIPDNQNSLCLLSRFSLLAVINIHNCLTPSPFQHISLDMTCNYIKN